MGEEKQRIVLEKCNNFRKKCYQSEGEKANKMCHQLLFNITEMTREEKTKALLVGQLE